MIAPEIRAIADAILYEGYILYPYRKSAIKNQHRWTFGSLFPAGFAEHAGERARMQCECLLRGNDNTRVGAHIRFLQIAARKIAKFERPVRSFNEKTIPALAFTDALKAGGRTYLPWDEAIAREIEVPSYTLGELTNEPLHLDLEFEQACTYEPVHGEEGIEGLIVREMQTVCGHAILSAKAMDGGLYKLTFAVENTSARRTELEDRQRALPFSFASTHFVLSVQDGEFLSLTDPPTEFADAARACGNDGCWPVLAGEEGSAQAMLAAPIILYDYPKVAPESLSNLFDGTEIDEILSLRILTMTDAEKEEMASADARAHALLQRVQEITPEDMAQLHGTWRASANISQCGTELNVGERVRLKPREGGDIFDMALAGKLAIIEAIERDFEDRVHVAVVLEDDPGRDFGFARLPGHRFFFSPEEIEPVTGSKR